MNEVIQEDAGSSQLLVAKAGDRDWSRIHCIRTTFPCSGQTSSVFLVTKGRGFASQAVKDYVNSIERWCTEVNVTHSIKGPNVVRG